MRATTLLLTTLLVSLSACGPWRAKFPVVLSNHCEYRVEPNIGGRYYQILDTGDTRPYEVEVIVQNRSSGGSNGPDVKYGRAPVTGRNAETNEPLEVREVEFHTNREPAVVFCEGGDGRLRVHYKEQTPAVT